MKVWIFIFENGPILIEAFCIVINDVLGCIIDRLLFLLRRSFKIVFIFVLRFFCYFFILLNKKNNSNSGSGLIAYNLYQLNFTLTFFRQN